jgi:plastocyanin
MRTFPTLLVAVLLVGPAACSSDDDTATPSPAPSASSAAPTTSATAPATSGTVHDVRALKGNRFSPTALTLAVGDSVKVTNSDPDVPHNFIVAGVGSSPTLQSADTFTLRFDKAGSFEFVCSFHDGMEGTVTVG